MVFFNKQLLNLASSGDVFGVLDAGVRNFRSLLPTDLGFGSTERSRQALGGKFEQHSLQMEEAQGA